ncbi:MAG: biopolymer transporter ExbD [Planctomycetes bacterium]|nr:biopolymer transporter ExbD [Planctomycetota bacterium]
MAIEIKKGNALSAINFTSLIDVVFLLLIFFLVASRFAEEDRQLEVRLPNASEAKPLTDRPREIIVNIDDGGNYFVGDSKMTLDEVDLALRQATANNPAHQTVNIRADKRVGFEAVVLVLNLCKRHAIENYSIDTR